ncbi:sulfurtransferase-like selenium metabolism protein YedF [Thermodesulfobacteriota bacterium]
MKEIDARGLACPAPVLQTKAAVEHEGLNQVKVIVDNAAAQQNVQRFLESRGFETTRAEFKNDFWVIGKSDATPSAKVEPTPQTDVQATKIMVMIATDRMGVGDDALGRKLMINFINTLVEMGPDLWRLVFVNNGVKLTIRESAVVATLRELESRHRQILVCGTCLNHFNLLEEKAVGETTNMLDIISAMQLADKVINI